MSSNLLNQMLSVAPGVIPSVLSSVRGLQFNTAAGLTVNPQISNIPVTIGGFSLVGFEAPTHLNVGGQQRLAIHDFPGGARTVQSLGAFPPNEISWEGIFLGSNAWTRAYELDRIRVDGQYVLLLYGSWGYTGKIRHLEIIAKHQWFCRYRLFFIPESDLATPPVVPSSQSSTTVVNSSMGQLASNTPTTVFGDTLPTSVTSPLSSFTAAVSTAMNAAGGVFSNITSTAGQLITQYGGATLASVQTLVNNGTTSLSMMASGLLVGSQVGNITNQVSPPTVITSTITQNNPNLMQLASQYYGDSSQWPKIAKANGLNDPLPTGTFSINIPQ